MIDKQWKAVGAVALVLIIGAVLFFVQKNQDSALVGEAKKIPTDYKSEFTPSFEEKEMRPVSPLKSISGIATCPDGAFLPIPEFVGYRRGDTFFQKESGASVKDSDGHSWTSGGSTPFDLIKTECVEDLITCFYEDFTGYYEPSKEVHTASSSCKNAKPYGKNSCKCD